MKNNFDYLLQNLASAIVLVIISLRQGHAGSCVQWEPNADVLKQVIVSTTTRVFVLFTSPEGPKDLRPQFYSSADGNSKIPCSFSRPSRELPFPRLGCNSIPVSSQELDQDYGYEFFSRSRRGDRTELLINPITGLSLWFDTWNSSVKWAGGNLIPRWLMRNGFVPAETNKRVEVYEVPQASSKIVATCLSFVKVEKKWVGDWMEVICASGPEKGAQGWTRWRSKEGRLRFLPISHSDCDE